jgi:N6-adenosine-specific RNA methylase IME4
MMRIGDVRVGKRHRRNMGDLTGLAASIVEIGLLHPIVIRPDGTLIAGERRLRAVESLGWKEVPVTVIDIDSIVRGEYAENTQRKDFTLSEAVAIKRTLEPMERAAARARMGSPENFSEQAKGNAFDKIATVTGVHRTTLAKAEAIVDAATAEPERFGRLLADMDRTGRVNGIYKRLRVVQQAERIRAEPPPLPTRGPYRVVVIDYPWPYEPQQDDPSRRAARPYPTMSIAQMCDFARRLSPLLYADSIVWVWCTNFHLIPYAAPVIDALGAGERAILTWVKNNIGTGDWLRSQTEHCIMAVRGHPTVTLTNESTVLFASAGGHSAKPKEFYGLIERLCPAPRYLDVFSRYRHSDKWDCHGDEAPKAPPAPDVADDLSIPVSLRRPVVP